MSEAPVADATVLIYLARIGHLSLLDRLYPDVLVPTAVYEECVERGRAEGYQDAITIDGAFEQGLTLLELDLDPARRIEQLRKSAELGSGEAAVIAGAIDRNTRCLTDDRAARQTGEAMGLEVGGTIYVLLRALEEELLSLEDYIDAIDTLVEEGFRMDAKLYRRAIEAGRTLGE